MTAGPFSTPSCATCAHWQREPVDVSTIAKEPAGIVWAVGVGGWEPEGWGTCARDGQAKYQDEDCDAHKREEGGA
jgi:hypothetical protein